MTRMPLLAALAAPALALAFVLSLEGCDDSGRIVNPPFSPDSVAYSFEGSMEGWTPRGTDLEHGSGQIDWSITVSADTATVGQRSLKLYLNNLNDAGKIWVERGFFVLPNRTYAVRVYYDFGTSDFGSANLFTLIAGAAAEPPRSAQDLAPFFPGNTGTGSDQPGFVWLPKFYEFDVRSGLASRVYVFLGVWGNWETARTYYIDNVRIAIQERLE